MASLDLDQIDRDAFDELARERDRQREPLSGRARAFASYATAALPPGAASRPAPFRAFQARMQDAVNRSHAFTDEDTLPPADSEIGIVALNCPWCARSVHVTNDSDGETVTCYWCKTPLVTRQGSKGVELEHVRLQRGGP